MSWTNEEVAALIVEKDAEIKRLQLENLQCKALLARIHGLSGPVDAAEAKGE